MYFKSGEIKSVVGDDRVWSCSLMEIEDMGKYWALLGACPNVGPILYWFKPVHWCVVWRVFRPWVSRDWGSTNCMHYLCIVQAVCICWYYSVARVDLKGEGKERKWWYEKFKQSSLKLDIGSAVLQLKREVSELVTAACLWLELFDSSWSDVVSGAASLYGVKMAFWAAHSVRPMSSYLPFCMQFKNNGNV